MGALSRSCIRCGLPLEDAASLNEGIGPVCRKKDNRLLAVSLPAIVHAARLHFGESVQWLHRNPTASPEVVDGVRDVEQRLCLDSTTDWRGVIKRLEFLLSFSDFRDACMDSVCRVADALGYIGMTCLWRGEASTGEAKVWFESGRLCVQGPRNRAVASVFKRIPSWLYCQHTKHWSFSAVSASDVAYAVRRFYPINNGLDSALAAALGYTPAESSLPETVLADSGKLHCKEVGDNIHFSSEYNVAFVSDLKRHIPFAMRRWDSNLSCWVVHTSFRDVLFRLAKIHFGTDLGPTVPAPFVGPLPF
jgi:hypothetical protein